MRLITFAVSAVLALCGCAAFPTAPSRAAPADRFADGLDARAVFAQSLAAHGGDLRQYDGDINLSTDGRWYRAIQRIQPVVTDAAFRVTSQERYRPRDGVYAVAHAGPGGRKQVLRTRDGLAIHYNGVPETDPVKRRATAMTNDAFRLFHFGPTFVAERATSMVRLPDAREGGRTYRRVLATLAPGFGEAATDDVVLWIDAGTARLFRVHMTLNGFETTQGAHVDTTFLAYRQVGPYLLPTRFHERVRGPIRITAHEWWTTGIDLDRGWTDAEVSGPALAGRAAAPAAVMPTDTR